MRIFFRNFSILTGGEKSKQGGDWFFADIWRFSDIFLLGPSLGKSKLKRNFLRIFWFSKMRILFRIFSILTGGEKSKQGGDWFFADIWRFSDIFLLGPSLGKSKLKI